MKFFFSSLFGAITGTFIGVILLVLVTIGTFSALISSAVEKDEMPDKAIVLTLDLRNKIADQPATDPFETLLSDQVSFVDILIKLHAAAHDDRVKAVFVRASETGTGSARAEELRAAFAAIKSTGKFIVVHTQGSYGGGPSGYRAIAMADEIWIQPGSDIIASGVSLETMFFRDLFDNIGITPEFESFYEFKNAANPFEESGYTDAHRQAETRIAQSIWDRSVADIAADRDLNPEQVRTALESGPVAAPQMISLNLADKEGWPVDARNAATERAGKDSLLLAISDYTAPGAPASAPAIAIVGGEGAIMTGVANNQPFQARNMRFASDTVSSALFNAARDDDVKAIVFRVESPGGSAIASDQIWHAVKTIRSDYKKPVIVSMGSVAASGGYYVAAGADWIVAKPGTITGSIGVLGGKLAMSQGLARIGINAESINVGGSFTGALTSKGTFTDAQRALFRSWLKRIYDRFVTVVAEGRGMTVAQADEIARGRVWTGEDAFEIGLVDELGGLHTAIAKARELAGIQAGDKVRLVRYPQPDWPAFLNKLSLSTSSQMQTVTQLGELLDDQRVQALITRLDAMQTSAPEMRAQPSIER